MFKVLMNHGSIVATIFFAVVSQTLIKLHMQNVNVPEANGQKIIFLLQQLIIPQIFLGIVFTLLSGLSWMLAMSKFELSYAYSFLGLNFILTFIIGIAFFDEPFVFNRAIGVCLIFIALIFIAKG